MNLPSGYTEVTQEQFFAAMGPRNVHPCPRGSWDEERGGYWTEWRLSGGAGAMIGFSQGGRFALPEREG